MSGPADPSEENLAALRAEIDDVERDLVSHIEPGRWALVIAVSAFALLVAAVLPWVGSDTGWQVLLDQTSDEHRVGLLPRLFATSSLLFGVLLSAVSMFSRRWSLAWVCALGCGFSVLHGIWAVWSRQTSGGAGPGFGMVLALLAMLVITAQWARLALSRPG